VNAAGHDALEMEADAVRAVLARQFEHLSWAAGDTPDYAPVLADFVPGAHMYASRRPAAAQSAAEFCARLERLRVDGTLASFRESMLGAHIRIFGNVAIALAACEMLENEVTTTRDVSGFLLLKDGGRWRIAAQAWDIEREGLSVPALS
jgi:hypothetical protein